MFFSRWEQRTIPNSDLTTLTSLWSPSKFCISRRQILKLPLVTSSAQTVAASCFWFRTVCSADRTTWGALPKLSCKYKRGKRSSRQLDHMRTFPKQTAFDRTGRKRNEMNKREKSDRSEPPSADHVVAACRVARELMTRCSPREVSLPGTWSRPTNRTNSLLPPLRPWVHLDTRCSPHR